MRWTGLTESETKSESGRKQSKRSKWSKRSSGKVEVEMAGGRRVRLQVCRKQRAELQQPDVVGSQDS